MHNLEYNIGDIVEACFISYDLKSIKISYEVLSVEYINGEPLYILKLYNSDVERSISSSLKSGENVIYRKVGNDSDT